MVSSDVPVKIKRPPKPKPINPIELVIRPWLQKLPDSLLSEIDASIESLVSASPKRWVVYSPMLLLPSGSFSSSPWTQMFSMLSNILKGELFANILESVSKKEGKVLTHLAINAGIPLHKDERDEENILRSPSGLLMLHGDFGPSLQLGKEPGEEDFAKAFWVSVKQNGIEQVWAPRWTMFSRGNVKEKARLLGFHDKDGLGEDVPKRQKGDWTAVDLYAGIGYFVFSYVAMGVGRVMGWELNPWSVEGLRRGAVANGWSVRVVKRGHEMEKLGDERIIIFLENNEEASERLKNLDDLGKVKHVNCGFLPTSEPTWEKALAIVDEDGWLHLHENVGVADVDKRKDEIEEMFRTWLRRESDKRVIKVEHVEFVKTFAPDVWHCVIDVHISK